MLNEVERTIKNLPSISFEEYYTQYVSQVQDHLICAEVRQASSFIYGAKSISALEKSVEKLLEGMVDPNDLLS